MIQRILGYSNKAMWDYCQTLDGKVYKVIDNNFTFDIEMLADWGATGSLCEILWGVTESAPNTGINTVMTAASVSLSPSPIEAKAYSLFA